MLIALSTSLGLFSRPSLRFRRYWAGDRCQSRPRTRKGVECQHTHLRARHLPHLHNSQASQRAHGPDLHLIVLVGIEPLDLLAGGEHLPRSSELHVALRAEEEAVAALALVKLAAGLPVVGAQPLLAQQGVGVREAVCPELSVQIIVGVVRGPDLVMVLPDRVAVHAGEDEVLRPHEGGPLLQVRDGGGCGVVEEHRSEREEHARLGRVEVVDPVEAAEEVAPEAGAGDIRVLRCELVEVRAQGLVRDVEREVGRLVAALLEDGKEPADLAEITAT